MGHCFIFWIVGFAFPVAVSYFNNFYTFGPNYTLQRRLYVRNADYTFWLIVEVLFFVKTKVTFLFACNQFGAEVSL